MIDEAVFLDVKYATSRASLVAQLVRNLPAMQENLVQFLGWEDPLEKEWPPTPIFWPGEFHGQRSLAGYNPWGHKELDTNEWLPLIRASKGLCILLCDGKSKMPSFSFIFEGMSKKAPITGLMQILLTSEDRRINIALRIKRKCIIA